MTLKFCNILVCTSLWDVYYITKAVQAVIGRMLAIGALTLCSWLASMCGLKAVQINEKCRCCNGISHTLSQSYGLIISVMLYIVPGLASGLVMCLSTPNQFYCISLTIKPSMNVLTIPST